MHLHRGIVAESRSDGAPLQPLHLGVHSLRLEHGLACRRGQERYELARRIGCDGVRCNRRAVSREFLQ